MFSDIDQRLFIVNSRIKVTVLDCVWKLNDPDYFVKLLLVHWTQFSGKIQEKTKVEFEASVLSDIVILVTQVKMLELPIKLTGEEGDGVEGS